MAGDWRNPLTDLAREQDCGSCGRSCGKPARGFYVVQFYILPAKLVRKRHKARKQTVILCRDCYEDSATLSYLLDGQQVSVPKVPRVEDSDQRCTICSTPVEDFLPGLYGLIASTFMIDDSFIENFPLAIFCGRCVEAHTIDLAGAI